MLFRSRAKAILKDLEAHAPKIEVREVEEEEDLQMSLTNYRSDDVAEKLRGVNVNTMTPIEALNLVFELQKMVE